MLLVDRALLAMSAVCLVSGRLTPNHQADAATDHAGNGGS
jgi:hypothetical protein